MSSHGCKPVGRGAHIIEAWTLKGSTIGPSELMVDPARDLAFLFCYKSFHGLHPWLPFGSPRWGSDDTSQPYWR
ncbi:hypothetical protein Desti_3908 [Desulfomonile tiedjei DSM 6799]|uniref:Uncharacterized protein n=1 Tax=Desulfomonile tiedjei (strain ATCC 49306 / DSM 6799 / DCB-1) TaxID=706587 RepID=I4CAF9_DESTA|nr:hypothetical protein Desti_3908 [Desulfomonile tiedjei DSM 6799]